jgi:hypothetical protein
MKNLFKITKSKYSERIIGWPPLIICGPSGSGKVRLTYVVDFNKTFSR